MPGWLGQQWIEPHIPVWDKAKRDDGTLSRDDFAFGQVTSRPPMPHQQAGHMTAPEQLQNVKLTLAKREPSIHDPKRTFMMLDCYAESQSKLTRENLSWAKIHFR